MNSTRIILHPPTPLLRAQGSGVISVVVFGLYGNWTSKWGMLSSSEESGAFDSVWDTITFSANGLVFFWSGIAAINYTVKQVHWRMGCSLFEN